MFQKVKDKVKQFAGSVYGKVCALGAVVPVLAVGASAAEGDATVVTASDWSSVISAITSQISVSTVVAVIASGAAAAIGFVFLWWGVRKVTRMIMSAWRKGKLTP